MDGTTATHAVNSSSHQRHTRARMHTTRTRTRTHTCGRAWFGRYALGRCCDTGADPKTCCLNATLPDCRDDDYCDCKRGESCNQETGFCDQNTCTESTLAPTTTTRTTIKPTDNCTFPPQYLAVGNGRFIVDAERRAQGKANLAVLQPRDGAVTAKFGDELVTAALPVRLLPSAESSLVHAIAESIVYPDQPTITVMMQVRDAKSSVRTSTKAITLTIAAGKGMNLPRSTQSVKYATCAVRSKEPFTGTSVCSVAVPAAWLNVAGEISIQAKADKWKSSKLLGNVQTKPTLLPKRDGFAYAIAPLKGVAPGQPTAVVLLVDAPKNAASFLVTFTSKSPKYLTVDASLGLDTKRWNVVAKLLNSAKTKLTFAASITSASSSKLPPKMHSNEVLVTFKVMVAASTPSKETAANFQVKIGQLTMADGQPLTPGGKPLPQLAPVQNRNGWDLSTGTINIRHAQVTQVFMFTEQQSLVNTAVFDGARHEYKMTPLYACSDGDLRTTPPAGTKPIRCTSSNSKAFGVKPDCSAIYLTGDEREGASHQAVEVSQMSADNKPLARHSDVHVTVWYPTGDLPVVLTVDTPRLRRLAFLNHHADCNQTQYQGTTVYADAGFQRPGSSEKIRMDVASLVMLKTDEPSIASITHKTAVIGKSSGEVRLTAYTSGGTRVSESIALVVVEESAGVPKICTATINLVRRRESLFFHLDPQPPLDMFMVVTAWAQINPVAVLAAEGERSTIHSVAVFDDGAVIPFVQGHPLLPSGLELSLVSLVPNTLAVTKHVATVVVNANSTEGRLLRADWTSTCGPRATKKTVASGTGQIAVRLVEPNRAEVRIGHQRLAPETDPAHRCARIPHRSTVVVTLHYPGASGIPPKDVSADTRTVFDIGRSNDVFQVARQSNGRREVVATNGHRGEGLLSVTFVQWPDLVVTKRIVVVQKTDFQLATSPYPVYTGSDDVSKTTLFVFGCCGSHQQALVRLSMTMSDAPRAPVLVHSNPGVKYRVLRPGSAELSVLVAVKPRKVGAAGRHIVTVPKKGAPGSATIEATCGGASTQHGISVSMGAVYVEAIDRIVTSSGISTLHGVAKKSTMRFWIDATLTDKTRLTNVFHPSSPFDPTTCEQDMFRFKLVPDQPKAAMVAKRTGVMTLLGNWHTAVLVRVTANECLAAHEAKSPTLAKQTAVYCNLDPAPGDVDVGDALKEPLKRKRVGDEIAVQVRVSVPVGVMIGPFDVVLQFDAETFEYVHTRKLFSTGEMVQKQSPGSLRLVGLVNAKGSAAFKLADVYFKIIKAASQPGAVLNFTGHLKGLNQADRQSTPIGTSPFPRVFTAGTVPMLVTKTRHVRSYTVPRARRGAGSNTRECPSTCDAKHAFLHRKNDCQCNDPKPCNPPVPGSLNGDCKLDHTDVSMIGTSLVAIELNNEDSERTLDKLKALWHFCEACKVYLDYDRDGEVMLAEQPYAISVNLGLLPLLHTFTVRESTGSNPCLFDLTISFFGRMAAAEVNVLVEIGSADKLFHEQMGNPPLDFNTALHIHTDGYYGYWFSAELVSADSATGMMTFGLKGNLKVKMFNLGLTIVAATKASVVHEQAIVRKAQLLDGPDNGVDYAFKTTSRDKGRSVDIPLFGGRFKDNAWGRNPLHSFNHQCSSVQGPTSTPTHTATTTATFTATSTLTSTATTSQATSPTTTATWTPTTSKTTSPTTTTTASTTRTSTASATRTSSPTSTPSATGTMTQTSSATTTETRTHTSTDTVTRTTTQSATDTATVTSSLTSTVTSTRTSTPTTRSASPTTSMSTSPTSSVTTSPSTSHTTSTSPTSTFTTSPSTSPTTSTATTTIISTTTATTTATASDTTSPTTTKSTTGTITATTTATTTESLVATPTPTTTRTTTVTTTMTTVRTFTQTTTATTTMSSTATTTPTTPATTTATTSATASDTTTATQAPTPQTTSQTATPPFTLITTPATLTTTSSGSVSTASSTTSTYPWTAPSTTRNESVAIATPSITTEGTTISTFVGLPGTTITPAPASHARPSLPAEPATSEIVSANATNASASVPDRAAASPARQPHATATEGASTAKVSATGVAKAPAPTRGKETSEGMATARQNLPSTRPNTTETKDRVVGASEIMAMVIALSGTCCICLCCVFIYTKGRKETSPPSGPGPGVNINAAAPLASPADVKPGNYPALTLKESITVSKRRPRPSPGGGGRRRGNPDHPKDMEFDEVVAAVSNAQKKPPLALSNPRYTTDPASNDTDRPALLELTDTMTTLSSPPTPPPVAEPAPIQETSMSELSAIVKWQRQYITRLRQVASKIGMDGAALTELVGTDTATGHGSGGDANADTGTPHGLNTILYSLLCRIMNWRDTSQSAPQAPRLIAEDLFGVGHTRGHLHNRELPQTLRAELRRSQTNIDAHFAEFQASIKLCDEKISAMTLEITEESKAVLDYHRYLYKCLRAVAGGGGNTPPPVTLPPKVGRLRRLIEGFSYDDSFPSLISALEANFTALEGALANHFTLVSEAHARCKSAVAQFAADAVALHDRAQSQGRHDAIDEACLKKSLAYEKQCAANVKYWCGPNSNARSSVSQSKYARLWEKLDKTHKVRPQPARWPRRQAVWEFLEATHELFRDEIAPDLQTERLDPEASYTSGSMQYFTEFHLRTSAFFAQWMHMEYAQEDEQQALRLQELRRLQEAAIRERLAPLVDNEIDLLRCLVNDRKTSLSRGLNLVITIKADLLDVEQRPSFGALVARDSVRAVQESEPLEVNPRPLSELERELDVKRERLEAERAAFVQIVEEFIRLPDRFQAKLVRICECPTGLVRSYMNGCDSTIKLLQTLRNAIIDVHDKYGTTALSTVLSHFQAWHMAKDDGVQLEQRYWMLFSELKPVFLIMGASKPCRAHHSTTCLLCRLQMDSFDRLDEESIEREIGGLIEEHTLQMKSFDRLDEESTADGMLLGISTGPTESIIDGRPIRWDSDSDAHLLGHAHAPQRWSSIGSGDHRSSNVDDYMDVGPAATESAAAKPLARPRPRLEPDPVLKRQTAWSRQVGVDRMAQTHAGRERPPPLKATPLSEPTIYPNRHLEMLQKMIKGLRSTNGPQMRHEPSVHDIVFGQSLTPVPTIALPGGDEDVPHKAAVFLEGLRNELRNVPDADVNNARVHQASAARGNLLAESQPSRVMATIVVRQLCAKSAANAPACFAPMCWEHPSYELSHTRVRARAHTHRTALFCTCDDRVC